ncbi:DUF1109 domain-containing protein [Piscinibacter sp. HJYY11]|uniref:DUF1109 domain-containing protein n=1 Tax=Piscinibacter sp. HJYY11 TaxID=2801333 RepID=UPI00191CDEE4|nr:DUF1109 domain-containing protein [Piscinibacter sp. HJYY11]MBL0726596.1 DUF1109 domain-containing protein [Piscinibacter sp. HJYY11]
MKTETWVDMLARSAGPAPRAVAARRFAPAALGGLLCSALLAVTLIGRLPASAFDAGYPWMKLAYTGALAVAACWMATRAARPAASTAPAGLAVLAVVLAMAAIATAALVFRTAPDNRAEAILGASWQVCPLAVLVLSLPALGLSLWAMRGLAPTRPRMAGFSAGVLAGAVGAFGYALACPESSMAFVTIWYTLGIGLAGLLGAALGQRLLRW